MVLYSLLILEKKSQFFFFFFSCIPPSNGILNFKAKLGSFLFSCISVFSLSTFSLFVYTRHISDKIPDGESSLFLSGWFSLLGIIWFSISKIFTPLVTAAAELKDQIVNMYLNYLISCNTLFK